MIRQIGAILLASATPVVADVAFLGIPIDCVIGETCVIEDYPDIDPSDAAADYRCGLKTQDGQNGTGFALLSLEQMRDGVSVVAAADGLVSAVRITEPDRPFAPGTTLEGRDCGNAVRLEHANGYQSVYCHLKQGSVRVTQGQTVTAGQVLGQVGLSGRTVYPHLHLTITQREAVIDPFAPDQANACESPEQDLWLDTPAYTDAGLFAAGVSNHVPNMEDVQSGAAAHSKLSPLEPMVLYGFAFHGDKDDTLSLVLRGPEGEVFAHTASLTQDERQFFRAFGRRPPETGWPRGAYQGTVQMIRDGRILALRHANIVVE